MHRITPISVASLTLLTFSLTPLANAQVPGSALNRWTRTADLSAARAQSCAAVLNDGRLVVAGGLGDSGPVAIVDIYGTDGAFSAGAPMNQARARAACVTLNDGRVLVAGGNDGTGSLSTAEIFDPSANTWTPTASLSVAREGHQMALTSWGSAWVAGGTSNGTITGVLELFLPETGKFQTRGALNTARAEFAMTPVGRTSLIVAGGADGTNTLSSVEIYDGSTGQLSVAGSMAQARKDFAAAALLDGTLLMIGGVDINGSTLSSTEIFDPVKGTSVAGPALHEPRASHSAYAMRNNGSVLIYGGLGNSGALGTTEIYTPWTGGIVQGSALLNARHDEAKAALRPGSYMVAGGRNDQGFLSGSELFQFSTIASDKADYAPGTAVKIFGGGWVPGEQVLVTLTAFPVDQHHIEFTGSAVADGAGNITVSGFAVDQSHLGMKFLMNAIGSQSQAESTFTDGVDPTITYNNPFAPGAPGSAVSVTVNVAGVSPNTPTGSIVICAPSGTCPTNLTVTGGGCAGGICPLTGGANFTASDTFTVAFPAGMTSFSVQYSGDGNYNVENPGANAPIVNYTAQNFTSTNLTGGPASPAPYGTQTPYVANVCISSTSNGLCDTAGTLSGTVAFSVAGAPASNATVPINGTVTAGQQVSVNFIPNPPLPVGGPYTITAVYLGDSGNATSNSASVNGGAASISTTITAVATTTSYTLTANPSVYGQPVSANVTVASNVGGSGTPTGTVSVSVDGVVVNGSAALVGGAVTVPLGNTATVAASPHSISVTYTPTAGSGYLGSAANTPSLTVNQAPTTTAAPVYQSGNLATQNALYYAVTVTGNNPSTLNPNSGTVTLNDSTINGNPSIGSSTLGTVSTANCPTVFGPNVACILITSPLPLGSNNVTASYGGNANFVGSGPSATTNVNVTGPVPTTWGTPTQTLPGAGNATFGGALTVQGSVIASAGTTAPDGHVNFVFDVAAANASNVNATSNTNTNPYTAFFALSPSTTVLGGGNHTVYTTNYGSTSGQFTAPIAANSPTFNFTINPALAPFTITSTVSSGSQTVVSSSVTMTATYTGGLTPTPTGTITFVNSSNANALICSGTLGGLRPALPPVQPRRDLAAPLAWPSER